MTDTQQLLCRHPPVCNDTHQCRHHNGYNPLHRIEYSYMCSQARGTEITRHGCKIGPPNRELEEIHDDKTNFQRHLLNC